MPSTPGVGYSAFAFYQPMLSFSMPCCVQREAGPWVSLILRLPDGSDPMGSTAKARRAGGERSGGVSSLLLSCLEAASLIETVHRFSHYRMSPSTWLQLLLSPNSTISSPGPLSPSSGNDFYPWDSQGISLCWGLHWYCPTLNIPNSILVPKP